jgi:hypothetical protein
MTALIDVVQKDLKDSGADKETLELWNSIMQWYGEGGPDLVDEGITKMMKGIKSVANKQLKETKEVVPGKKKKRRSKK